MIEDTIAVWWIVCGFFLLWSLAFGLMGRLRCCPFEVGSDDASASTVSVIIPARNERERLPILLDSLAAQDQPTEVIVVDDNSTDGTGGIAGAYGVTTYRLTEPEDGWLGKPRACWYGALQARGDILVFLDADTKLAPSGLSRIVAAQRRHGGLLSVQPYHEMRHLYERFSAYFSLILLASSRSFTIFGKRISSTASFGPCMVCPREDYLRMGGHALVRGEILDDVALGQAMRRRGIPLTNYVGRGTIAFRMYPGGLAEVVSGWTKNFAHGAMSTDLLVLVLISLWIAGSVAAVDAALGFRSEGWSSWVIAGVLAYVAYVVQLYWLLRQIGNFGLLPALCYPLFLMFFVGVFLRSLYLTMVRNTVTWKGRTISVRSRF